MHDRNAVFATPYLLIQIMKVKWHGLERINSHFKRCRSIMQQIMEAPLLFQHFGGIRLSDFDEIQIGT